MKTSVQQFKTIVIGGGASGMIAAIFAAEGGSVLLLEKNQRMGEKLRISGGGRCNLLNAEEDERLLLANYGRSEQYLYSAFNKFGMNETRRFFEEQNLRIKVEARKRAFPASDNSADVIRVLTECLKRNNVEIITDAEVAAIEDNGDEITSIKCGRLEYSADNYIFATGGTSRPETGSTGDGFGWLRRLGHNVKPPTPNITPLSVSESWVELASGNTATDASIIFYQDGTRKLKLKGPILFTHFGLSGPLILNNASKVSRMLEKGIVTASIDLRADVDEPSLDGEIINVLTKHPGKQLKNVLGYFIPAGFTAMVKRSLGESFDLDIKTSEVSKVNRRKIVAAIKAVELTIDDLMGFEKAVVADGGIDLNELDMRTMKSKIIKNLYVTGDLLDINRPTGGYSLQLCWTTGQIAGSEAAIS